MQLGLARVLLHVACRMERRSRPETAAAAAAKELKVFRHRHRQSLRHRLRPRPRPRRSRSRRPRTWTRPRRRAIQQFQLLLLLLPLPCSHVRHISSISGVRLVCELLISHNILHLNVALGLLQLPIQEAAKMKSQMGFSHIITQIPNLFRVYRSFSYRQVWLVELQLHRSLCYVVLKRTQLFRSKIFMIHAWFYMFVCMNA